MEHRFRVEGADETAVHRRDSARDGVVGADFARLAELPDQLAVGQGAAVDAPLRFGLIVIVVIDPPAHDGGGRVSLRYRDRPPDLGPAGRPLTKQPLFRGGAGAGRSGTGS